MQGEGQGRARGQAERGMHSTWQQQTDWPREILAWFQESEFKFEPIFSFQGIVGVGEQGRIL